MLMEGANESKIRFSNPRHWLLRNMECSQAVRCSRVVIRMRFCTSLDSRGNPSEVSGLRGKMAR